MNIRENSEEFYKRAYERKYSFRGSSMLDKPVRGMMECLSALKNEKYINVLDLGAGEGRNAIPVAKMFSEKICNIECVDNCEKANQLLEEYAQSEGLQKVIHATFSQIEDYAIQTNMYQMVIASFCLEHMESEERMYAKIAEMREGIKAGGMICLAVHTNLQEQAKYSGQTVFSRFELHLDTEVFREQLEKLFAEWQIMKSAVWEQSWEEDRNGTTVEVQADELVFIAQKPQLSSEGEASDDEMLEGIHFPYGTENTIEQEDWESRPWNEDTRELNEEWEQDNWSETDYMSSDQSMDEFDTATEVLRKASNHMVDSESLRESIEFVSAAGINMTDIMLSKITGEPVKNSDRELFRQMRHEEMDNPKNILLLVKILLAILAVSILLGMLNTMIFI